MNSPQSVLRISLFVLLVLLTTASIAPFLGLAAYENIDLKHRLLPPSSTHWFGTDELGRDVFSRLLHGGRISFLVSFIVVTISFSTGILLGSIAAWVGGWIDEIIMRLGDVLLAFPGLLLAIALMAVLGPNLQNVVLALIVIGWIPYARLARALVLKFRELDFVNASRSLGASSPRIWLFHIFPNMMPILFVQISFSFAGMILAESSLSFLGLGVQPPEPSWGNMLSDAKNHLLDAPYLTLFPGLAIFVSVMCLNLLGDSLRDPTTRLELCKFHRRGRRGRRGKRKKNPLVFLSVFRVLGGEYDVVDRRMRRLYNFHTPDEAFETVSGRHFNCERRTRIRGCGHLKDCRCRCF